MSARGLGDRAQMRTYVKFVNLHLPPEHHITTLSDLRTSERLYELMSEIFKRRGVEFGLRREKRTRAALRSGDQYLEVSDITKILQLVHSKSPRGSVGIDAHQVHRGNSKSISALVWNIILNYYVFSDESVGRVGSPYRSLAKWVNDTIAPRHGRVSQLENWRRGGKDAWARVVPLYHLIETLTADDESPERVEFVREAERIIEDGSSPLELARICTNFADEKMDIPKLLESEDFAEENLEERSITTYLSYFRNFARKKLEDLHRRKDYAQGLEKNVDSLQQALRDALQKLEEAERRRLEEQQRMNKVIDGLRTELGENSNRLKKLSGSKDALSDIVAEKTKRVENLLQTVEARDRKLAGLANQVDDLKKMADSQRAEFRTDLENLRKQRSDADDRWMKKNRSLQETLSQRDGAIAGLTSERDKLLDDLKRSEGTAVEARTLFDSELERAEKRIKNLEDDLTDRTKEVDGLRDRIESQEDELANLKSSNDRQNQRLLGMQQEKDRLEAELRVFTDRSFADFSDQTVLSSRDKSVQTDPYFQNLLDDKEKELAALRHTNADLESKLSTQTEKCDTLSKSQDDLVGKVHQLELDAVGRKRELERSERLLDDARSDLDRLKKQGQERENSLIRDRDQWKSLLDRKSDELQDLQDRLGRVNHNLDEEKRLRHVEKIEMQDSLRKLELERDEKLGLLKRAEEDADLAQQDHSREVQGLRDLLDAANQSLESLKGRLKMEQAEFQGRLDLKDQKLTDLSDKSSKREAELAAEIKSLNQGIASRDDTIVSAQASIADLNEKLLSGGRDWENQRSLLSTKLEDELSKRESVETDLAALRDEDDRRKAELAALSQQNDERGELIAKMQDDKSRDLSSIDELSRRVESLNGSLLRKEESLSELNRLRDQDRKDHESVVNDFRREKDHLKSLLSDRDVQLSEANSSLESSVASGDSLRKENADLQRRIRELEDEGRQCSAALTRAKNDSDRFRSLLDEKQQKVRELENLLYETKSDFEKYKLRNKLQMDDLTSLKSERDTIIEELEGKLADARSRHQVMRDEFKAKEDEWRRNKLRIQEDCADEVNSWQKRLREKDLELTALTETSGRDAQRQQQLLDGVRGELAAKDRSFEELQETADQLRGDLERSRRTLEEERTLASRRMHDRVQQIEDGASRLANAMSEMAQLKDAHLTDSMRMKKELESVSEDLHESERHCRQLEKEKLALLDDLSELRKDRADLESASVKKQGGLADEISKLRQALSDKDLKSSEAQQSWDLERDRLTRDLSNLDSTLKDTSHTLSQVEEDRDRLAAELARVQALLNSAQKKAEADRAESERRLDEKDVVIGEIRSELDGLQKTHSEAEAMWNDSKTSLTSDLDALRSREADLVKKLAEMQALSDSKSTKIAGLETELHSALSQVDSLGENLRSLEEKSLNEKNDLREKLRISEAELVSARDHGTSLSDQLSARIKKLEGMNQELVSINEDSQKQISDYSDEIRERTDELVALRKDHSGLLQELETSRDSEEEKSIEIEGLEGKLDELHRAFDLEKARALQLTKDKEGLLKTREELEEAASQEITELESQRDLANGRVSELAAETKQLRSRLIEKDAELSAARDDSSRLIAELRDQLKARDAEIVSLKAKIAELERLLEDRGIELRHAASSIDELTADRARVQSKLQSVEREREAQSHLLSAAQDEFSKYKTDAEGSLRKKESEISGLTSDLLDQQRRMNEAEDRHRKLLEEGDEIRQSDENRFAEMQKTLQDRLEKSRDRQENLLSQLDEAQTLISTMEQSADDHMSEIEDLKEDLRMAQESFDELLRDKESEAERAREKIGELMAQHTRVSEEYDGRLRELQSSLQQERDEKDALSRETAGLRRDLGQSEQKCQGLLNDLNESRENLLGVKRARAADELRNRDAMGELRKEGDSLRALLESLRGDLEREKDRSSRLEGERDEATDRITWIQKKLDEKNAEFLALQEQLRSSSGVNVDLDRLRARVKTQAEQMSSLKTRLMREMEAKFAAMNEQLRSKDAEIDKLTADVNEKAVLIKELEQRIAKLLEELKAANERPAIVVEPEPQESEGENSAFVTVDGEMEGVHRARTPDSVSTPDREFKPAKRSDRFFHETRESYQLSQAKMQELTQDDIREIAGYRRPPRLVHDTVKCVLLLITSRSTFELNQWKICRQYMLRRREFLKIVTAFRPQAYRRDIGVIRKIISTIEKKDVARSSKCAAVLYEFAHCAIRLIQRLRTRRSRGSLTTATARRRPRRGSSSAANSPRARPPLRRGGSMIHFDQ